VRDLAERTLVEQQAGRGFRATADAAAQLVQLGEAEALGMLDHHDRRIRHVDADLDHRRSDEDAGFAALEALHRLVLFGRLHPAVDEADDGSPRVRCRSSEAVFRRSSVDFLGFLDQRADPVGLGAFSNGGANALHHLLEPFERDSAGFDRLAAGRLVRQLRDVHVAEGGKHERARDRRRRHDEDVRWRALGRQSQALMHAEAVLFVDHGERES
jgi:hypothetical protein